MTKFNKEELLIMRSALLNFKKAPWVSPGENKIIKKMLEKIHKLFEEE
jgi:hypothetical protein